MPFVGLEVLRSGSYQRVGRSSDGHYHHVGGDVELRALNRHGTTASRVVGLAQLHTYAAHGVNPAILVAENLHRVAQQVEKYALLLGVMHLFGTGGQLLFRTTVNDMHFGAKPQCRTCGIHCYVAATYHHHTFANVVGSVVTVFV